MPPPPHSTTTATSVSPWSQRLLRGMALLLALMAGFYGVMAINTGYVNFKGAGNAEVAKARLELRQRADSGDASTSAEAIAEHSGLYLALVSQVTSAQYAYGSRGLSEPLVHYAEMPKTNGQVLALHNTMGGLLMLFGGLQFWPALRRRYPRAHRLLGMTYVVAASLAMVAAIGYLLMTPVDKVYDTFTFTVGLWLLAIGVLASIGMSMYHLRRRQIAQHQAYMAISYGFLLTAPVQRYLWLAVGAWQPQMRQLEGNFAVTAWLIPFSLLIGYGLFTINRMLQQRRPATRTETTATSVPFAQGLGKLSTLALLPLLGLGALATVQYFLITPGLANYPLAADLVPAGIIAKDSSVIGQDVAGRVIFSLATIIGLLIGARQLWQAFVRQQSASPVLGIGLAVTSALAGLVMTAWGIAIGLPSFATLAGGATWLCGGFICLLLTLLMAWAVRAREEAWIREWSVWIVLTLLGVPSFYAAMPVLAQIGIPAEYIATGHAYRLASYAQWFLLIPAFIYSAYGRATQERFAR